LAHPLNWQIDRKIGDSTGSDARVGSIDDKVLKLNGTNMEQYPQVL
jgi:hypothetical protein